MAWSTANHEVIPEQEFLLPDSTMHPYLWAFLQSDGEVFKESVDDYRALRQNLSTAISRFHGRAVRGRQPTDEVGPSRLRTWKSLFERAGLLSLTKDGLVEVTPFGRAVRDLFDDLSNRVAGANDHLAKWAVTVLARYPLLNPLEGSQGNGGPYPPDSDLLPFRAIWRAARELDGKLHWQELNRGLMLLHHEREVDATIKRIRDARDAGGSEYPSNPSNWLGEEAAVSDGAQTRRRVTPWLTRASFGGLLAEDDEDSGWWVLRADRVALIDEALQEQTAIPAGIQADRAAFVRWLSAPISRRITSRQGAEDRTLLKRATDAVIKFGKSKILCLSGIPGTGKSRLARMIAEDLTDGDPYRIMEIQFHEGTGYEDFVEGFVPRPDGSGFKLVDKTLRVISKRAAADPQSRIYVLVIEEFTRANAHAVLGELLTYVEHRDRRFRFSLSQEEASIPENLVIVTTMNPRDRSALQLDAAVRRRLHSLDVMSSPSALRSMLGERISSELLESLVGWYERWYKILPFGHGVFAEVVDDETASDVWHATCLKLIENALGDIDEIYQDAVQTFPCQRSDLN